MAVFKALLPSLCLMTTLMSSLASAQPAEYPATIPGWAGWLHAINPSWTRAIFDVRPPYTRGADGTPPPYPYRTIPWGRNRGGAPHTTTTAFENRRNGSSAGHQLVSSSASLLLGDGERVPNSAVLDDHSYVVRIETQFEGRAADGGGTRPEVRHCSGTVLADGWVLTAAHCLLDENGHLCDNVEVFAAQMNNNQATELPGIGTLKVASVACTTETTRPHPEWQLDTLHNDIALIRIPSFVTTTGHGSSSSATNDVHWQPSSFPILPMRYFTYPYLYGAVIGWDREQQVRTNGDQSTSSDIPRWEMRKADIYVDGNIVCMLTSLRRYLSFYQLCYESATRDKGVCNGIGGAPVLVSLTGEYHLVGISSVGLVGKDGKCSVQTPNIATRVSRYLDWIRETMATA